MPIARSLLELVIHGRRKQKENVDISTWTSPGFLPPGSNQHAVVGFGRRAPIVPVEIPFEDIGPPMTAILTSLYVSTIILVGAFLFRGRAARTKFRHRLEMRDPRSGRSWWFRYSLILFDEAATLSFPDDVFHAPGGQLLRFVRQHDLGHSAGR